jgi:hypothetical protein
MKNQTIIRLFFCILVFLFSDAGKNKILSNAQTSNNIKERKISYHTKGSPQILDNEPVIQFKINSHGYSWAALYFRVEGHFKRERSWGSDPISYFDMYIPYVLYPHGHLVGGEEPFISWDGNTLKSSWDFYDPELNSDSLSLVLNDKGDKILSFYGKTATKEKEDNFSGIDIPLTQTDLLNESNQTYYDEFKVEGEAICSHLTSLNYGPVDNGLMGVTTLESYSCIETNFIEIRLYKSEVADDFIPDGVAFDIKNPDPKETILSSIFKNLKVTGNNLSEVESIIFEDNDTEDYDMWTQNVRAKNQEVLFDLIIRHSATPGERDLILKKSNNETINMSELLDKTFMVTRILTEFNQAVGTWKLDEVYKNKLIAQKRGVVKIEFDDSKQNNKIYTGELEVSGIDDRTSSINPHTVSDNYTETDFFTGNNYLIIPFPQPLEEDTTEFKCILNRSDNLEIWGPVIEREIIESHSLNLIGTSIKFKKQDGNFLIPANEIDAKMSIDLLKLVYPISKSKITYRHLGNKEYEDTNMLTEIILSGTKYIVLTKKSREELVQKLSNEMNKQNTLRIEAGESEIHGYVVFLPANILFRDWGKVKYVAGLAYTSKKITLIGVTGSNIELNSVVAHEVGHFINTALSESSFDIGLLQGNDLGDEYKNGSFHCNVNPPIKEIKDRSDIQCTNSPYSLGLQGDSSGVYTDDTAFNPDNNLPTISYIGQTTATTRKKYNFMAGAVSGYQVWVTPLVYNELLKTLLPVFNPLDKTMDLLTFTSTGIQLAGIIYDNDDVVFNDFIETQSQYRTPESSGPYSFELQNNSGAVLVSRSFDLSFFELGEPPDYSDHEFFNIIMDYPAGTKKIVLKKNGIELTSRTVSENAPVVDIISPQGGGSLSGDVEISWTATDQDGDPLTYSILYAPDGTDWLPIDALLTETTYLWNSGQYPGGANAKIAVIASDGVNEGKDETSLAFSIETKGPVITITSPENNTTQSSRTPITFTASGYDHEDGSIPSSAFTFESNIDGVLGKGSPLRVDSLSTNTHTITVSAKDSDNNTSSADITITVAYTSVDGSETNLIPDKFKLYQNYPNPFNMSTKIEYDLPVSSKVHMTIYNMLGQKVRTFRDDLCKAGQHSFIWNGLDDTHKQLPTGLYFYRIQANSFVDVKKMLLLK